MQQFSPLKTIPKNSLEQLPHISTPVCRDSETGGGRVSRGRVVGSRSRAAREQDRLVTARRLETASSLYRIQTKITSQLIVLT